LWEYRIAGSGVFVQVPALGVSEALEWLVLSEVLELGVTDAYLSVCGILEGEEPLELFGLV
jgi:hypothetical protein